MFWAQIPAIAYTAFVPQAVSGSIRCAAAAERYLSVVQKRYCLPFYYF